MPILSTRNVTNSVRAQEWHTKALADVELMKRVPHFRLDNVAAFYSLHEKTEWKCGQDIPNWTPPFPAFFAEWNSPSHWRIDGEVQENRGRQFQSGLLVGVIEAPNKALKGDSDIMNAVRPLNVAMLEMLGELEETKSTRWVLIGSWWYSDQAAPIHGRPIYAGLHLAYLIGPEGQYLNHVISGPGAEELRQESNHPTHILGLGLSFCHCKNVKAEEQTDHRGERWHRRQKAPVLKYYTLNIDPIKKILRTEGRSEETGIRKALHICRGHFAHYGASNPLFGKYTGSFWKPAHVRGSKEAGVVHKNYSVGTT